MDEQTRAEFAEMRAILRDTQVKQDRNTEAISQLTLLMEQFRQSIVEERRLISDLRFEQAGHADDPNAHGVDDIPS